MKRSAYQLEHYRSELAAKGDLAKLKTLYTAKHPEIKDLNTAKFWNTIFDGRSTLAEQDGMTQDRTRITAALIPPQAKRILDIGIGAGWVEECLENRAIKLYGTDISDITIRQLKKRFPKWAKTLSVQSLYSMKFKPEFFDAILLLEVLEHIPPRKTFRVLAQVNKLLRKHGSFILSVPTNEGLETMTDNPSGHVRMYTQELIQAELELNGFKVQKMITLYAFLKFYRLKKFLAKWVFKTRWKPNNIIILAEKI